RRVGKVLCLQAQAVAVFVDVTGFAGDRAVEEVPGIELHTRLGRGHVERAAAVRIDEPCRVADAGSAVQYPVVMVALAVTEVDVVGVDARANRRRLAEVERCALDGREL